MKLNFKLLDGILEAREDKLYLIFFQDEVFRASVDGDPIASGDLYTCLDACNGFAIQSRAYKRNKEAYDRFCKDVQPSIDYYNALGKRAVDMRKINSLL